MFPVTASSHVSLQMILVCTPRLLKYNKGAKKITFYFTPKHFTFDK